METLDGGIERRALVGIGHQSSFHVMSVGWDHRLINAILDKVEGRTDFRFSHLCVHRRDNPSPGPRPGLGPIYRLDNPPLRAASRADRELLRSLEAPDIPTIHNMIMSDRVVRRLPYDEAIAYAAYLARQLTRFITKLTPSVVIGAFDNLVCAISLAVARHLGVPWFAMAFTALPKGLTSFCVGLAPSTGVPLRATSPVSLRALAERTLHEFEQRAIKIPVYLSANSTRVVIERLPRHARVLLRAAAGLMSGRYNRFTEFSASHLFREYLRKRKNLYTLPHRRFLTTPPEEPYVLFALHMQPESSIDVWAPFHSNQFSVVEALARSIPPTHRLLVKLHVSDADNYSRRELDRLCQLPGVKLVSPFAASRPLIERASLIAAIQGTIALEGAMLGKPVVMFGESKVADLPSVSSVGPVAKLPDLIRAKLAEKPPSREAIVDGLMSFFSCYAPGCFNDWEFLPTDEELDNLVNRFEALRDYVVARAVGAGPANDDVERIS